MNRAEEVEPGSRSGSHRAGPKKFAEVDLEWPEVEVEQHQVPPPQHSRRPNGRAGEGMRSGWRPCQQHSQSADPSVEGQNHRYGNQQRHRRYEASGRGGGRSRSHRPAEERGGQQLPRPGVARYRRAQHHKHKHRREGEAEPSQLPPPPPPPLEESEGSPTSACTGGSESNITHRGRAEGSAGVLPEGPEEEMVYTENTEAEQNGGMPLPIGPPPVLPLNSPYLTETLNGTCSSCKHRGSSGESDGEQLAEPSTWPPPEPYVEPHRKPSTEKTTEPSSHPCVETHMDPSAETSTNVHNEPHSDPYTAPSAEQQCLHEEMEHDLTLPGEWEWAGETVLQVRRAGLRLFGRGGVRLRQAVGLRLHHYDERSDSESESPEKEPSPFPSGEGGGLESKTEQREGRCRSQSWHKAIGEEEEQSESEQVSRGERSDEPQEELASQGKQTLADDVPQDEEAEVEHGTGQPQDEEAEVEHGAGQPQDEQGEVEQGQSEPQDELAEVQDEPGGHSGERGDAISLAIRDIKEAIEEVKTRTVRSPYTPEEPREPIWVMREDLSPTEPECDLQPPPEGDSPDSGSPSPLGAESINSQQAFGTSDSFETSPSQESRKTMVSFPTYVDVPGPCDPEDLIDGIIFAANYLGSTQLLSERTPSKSVRMTQAQEAVSRVQTAQKQTKGRKKAPEGEAQVDLFISTQRIKVLNADSQDTMMDHALRTISYIADIGDIVVLMARRKKPRPRTQETVETSDPAHEEKRQYRMICHVFESEDAQLIAQSIGQAFSVAYQEFLRANGINPEDLSQKEYSDLLSTQDMYNDDLIHFSKSENCKDVYIQKQQGEILGVVVVESGWGSILPTVIIANMMHGGPAEKSGRLNIGDQIMSINGTSLVGLPLATCQSIIKALKSQTRIKLNIVRCPPVTMVLIRRPDLRYQLGFSVQNGIICSLMRGGIAERGGVRVGHRIIEINGQSVVATPHEKIVSILSTAVGEIHMKTMPAAMYRLLTGQEQPIYI